MNTIRETIESFAYQHIGYLTAKVAAEGPDMTMEGIRCLDEPSRFTHGDLIHNALFLYMHYVKTGDSRAGKALENACSFVGFIEKGPVET